MAILADLHNHSCLSPCGSLELSPSRLAATAAERGIRLLALTDHNSALNCPAFDEACRRHGLVPLFGMEANTCEEVHVLCLFPTVELALDFGERLYGLLPDFRFDPERMGDQVYVDVDEVILGSVEKYLGAALDLGIDEIGALVRSCGGLPIPAHIDRPSFSMTSQLGFVVDGPWAALECMRLPPGVATHGYPLTTSSDAHHPTQVGRRAFSLEAEFESLLTRGPGSPVDMAALERSLALRPRA